MPQLIAICEKLGWTKIKSARNGGHGVPLRKLNG
jgi:hypothetical protein